MPCKVVKFGGSSLADAAQFRKVKEIIDADPARRYVIPSAPGKRFPDDTKVTDMLYACYDLAARGKDFTAQYEQIKDRYRSILTDLSLSLSLEPEFVLIEQAFRGKAGRDFAASRGEYLNGLILAAYLGVEFIDAAEVIFFGEDGVFDSERTNSVLRGRMAEHERAVIPGFYGSMPNDTIKTFPRGGSDITGSICARAGRADLYENWTDVSGFLMADPRIVDNPKQISTITYRELRELSYMGAGVLQEDSIFPVRIAGISINIKNTNDAADPGTIIVPSCEGNGADSVITGIAGKKGFSIVLLEKDMMNQEIGFGRRVLEVFERRGISFEHLPSGIDTMSVVVATADIAGQESELCAELCDATNADRVDIEHGLALIAVVGRRMIQTKGTAARVFAAVAHGNVNIKMIDQGSSELNIVLGVDEADFERTIRAIYEAFDD